MGIKIKGLVCGHDDIQNGFRYGPNSAGGVSVKGSFTNTGDKTIKYISIYFQPYNSVGDAVKCTIRGGI